MVIDLLVKTNTVVNPKNFIDGNDFTRFHHSFC